MIYIELAQKLRSLEVIEIGVGATLQEVSEAESHLGLNIEGSYRNFLLEFGWAGVEHIEINGLGADVPAHLDLISITESERRDAGLRLPSHLLPFYNDGAGNLFCVDYGDSVGQQIVLWNHEAGQDQGLLRVADDFAEWLYEELDNIQTDDVD